MGRTKYTPTYDLDEVKRLVANGDFDVMTRPRAYIKRALHRQDFGNIVADIIDSILPEDFRKSMLLDKYPGVWGDVYCPVPYTVNEEEEGDDWYVKFFVRDDEVVVVLSANIDGDQH